jgi:hypothetical protein
MNNRSTTAVETNVRQEEPDASSPKPGVRGLRFG